MAGGDPRVRTYVRSGHGKGGGREGGRDGGRRKRLPSSSPPSLSAVSVVQRDRQRREEGKEGTVATFVRKCFTLSLSLSPSLFLREIAVFQGKKQKDPEPPLTGACCDTSQCKFEAVDIGIIVSLQHHHHL